MPPQPAHAQDSLREEFSNPPPAARPRTWWHWTKGAVTKQGITEDLQWMHRVGIAGFQLADVNFGSGQAVDPPVDFGTPEWLDAVAHAAREADRLGLEMTVFSSPGWSITGGPWVEPHQAMKKLVWSEMQVTGPGDLTEPLPAPPANAGPFQDMGASRTRDAPFYRDVRVLAYRTPAAERGDARRPAEVTSHNGPVDAARLYDHSYDAALSIAAPDDGSVTWLQQRFDEPVTVRSITLADRAGIPVGRILASDDGQNYRPLVTLPGAQLYRQAPVRTFAIPATTATHFRLEITAAPVRPAETMSEAPPQSAPQYSLCEWRLDVGARIHRWQEKAGFRHLFQYDTVRTPAVDADAAIDAAEILDLTDHLQRDGTLQWNVPAGQWTILRLGYSLTGARNRPATPAGSGLEVDKLSRRHVSDYYDAYATLLKQAIGDLYGKRLDHWLVDSWEAGTQNWTDEMIAEFTRRRGYDPTPYLPVLVGRVVESADASDRFAWDFRRTLADMIAENHYGTLRDRLAADGLQMYSEASGVSLEIPEDTLLNKRYVDIPMGEFWVRDLHPRLMYLQDVRGAASAAHAYGKRFVAAEAFTGGGYESPLSLKRVSDYWFAQGINRLVFHTSAHQPLDTLPGNAMVGTHLHRHITWAESARPVNEYFARICHMLQQGQPVVDVAYLLDEGAPSTPPIWGAGTQPAPPEGYQHGFINADVLLNRLEVAADGRLVLPDGMSYRLLVLPNSRRMRPELLEKLHTLVAGGATVVGPRPLASPSLMGQPATDRRVHELAESLWGDLDGASRTVRYVGDGMVVWGRSLEQVLQRMELAPDFQWAGALDDQAAWTHRCIDGADIYYVSNLAARDVRWQTRFRVAGRAAELWRPDAGSATPATVVGGDGGSELTLTLAPHETLFVVFRNVATPRAVAHANPQSQRIELSAVEGPWNVSFPPDRGAPDQIQLTELASWTDHDAPGVRFFSGAATYAKTINAPEGWFAAGRRILLDLGEVRDLAQVAVNDQRFPLLWKPPFRIDVTDALQPGANELQIVVTNQWTNRIVGDRQSPAEQRVLPAAATASPFGPRELVDSGLLGPVRLFADDTPASDAK
ncbi:MAG: glycoside hydrolase [Planctomycetaceae bacterium]|nr:glycoside hydrolase [Planctomycetaceae bacterium]